MRKVGYRSTLKSGKRSEYWKRRSLHQHHVLGPQVLLHQPHRLGGVLRVLDGIAGQPGFLRSFSQGPRAEPETHQEREPRPRREASDVAVQIQLGRPELQHVAQHRDRPSLAADQVREREQRRLGAARIGVVAVVDQERAAGQPDGAHPPPGGGGVGQPAQDPLRLETEPDPDRSGRRRVVPVVRADQLQLHRPRSAEKLQLDAQPGPAVVGRDQAHVAALRRPEGQKLAPGQPRLAHHHRVVGIRHRHSAVAQRVEQLALRLCDSAQRADALEVHGTDVGDHRHVGVRPLREPGDLAQMVHPALDGRVAVLLAEAQESERDADLVVQVSIGLERRACRREHLGDQLLGAGLPRGPGDADHLEVRQPVPPSGGQRAQRAPRVGSGQDRDVLRLGADLLQRVRRNQDPRGTPLHRLGDKVAPVELLAAERHEQRLGNGLARVGEHAFERPARRGDLRARCPGCLLQREPGATHRAISSSARFASARSSKGRFSLPTIW